MDYVKDLIEDSRRGYFRVSSDLINLHRDVVVKVFSFIDFIPLGVRYDIDKSAYFYMGISSAFSLLSVDDEIPEYSFCHEELNPNKSVKVWRV